MSTCVHSVCVATTLLLSTTTIIVLFSTTDPQQRQVGFVSYGTVTIEGQPVNQIYNMLATPALKGSTQVTFQVLVVFGWLAGL